MTGYDVRGSFKGCGLAIATFLLAAGSAQADGDAAKGRAGLQEMHGLPHRYR